VFYSHLLFTGRALSVLWRAAIHTLVLFTQVARTVVAPPSSVVKCLWEVLVWGFGVVFLSCACVSVSGVLFSLSLCVCV